MIVTLKTNHNGNYFNIYEPGSGPGNEAMYAARMTGLRYEGILPANGDYTLSVCLMRYAARRDEKAEYSLEITVDGEVQADTGKSVEDDNIAWPLHTDASGDLPCSAGEPSFERSCAFKVKRNPYGATIWTVKPGTKEDLRILYFENKTFSTDDGSEMSGKRQGDNWWLAAGEKEFYLIPDAVIWGG